MEVCSLHRGIVFPRIYIRKFGRCKYVATPIEGCWSLKDKKRLRLRVIHLIEFIQSNTFHIYSIFYRQRFTQNVTLKSKILTKSTMV